MNVTVCQLSLTSRAPTMILSATWILYITPHAHCKPLCNLRKDVNLTAQSSDLDPCFCERDMPSHSHTTCPFTSLQLKTYSASYSFHLSANDSLISWFLLVATSSIFLSKNVNFFSAFRLDSAKYVSFPDTTQEAENLYAIGIDSGNSPSSENPSTPLGTTTCDSFSEVSDLDKASYWDDLFNLEGEDCEWISELKPSSPGSDSSDLDTATSYLDSLLSLEEEDSEWISDSTYLRCEAVSSAEDVLVLESQDMEDEPLFWPFEEEFNWNSEESFCVSPRKKHINWFKTPDSDKALGLKVVEGKSEASRSKARRVSGKKGIEKSRVVPRIKASSVGNGKKNVASKKEVGRGRGYCAVGEEVGIERVVGLEEFDGHEGVDAEFRGNLFMLLDMNE